MVLFCRSRCALRDRVGSGVLRVGLPSGLSASVVEGQKRIGIKAGGGAAENFLGFLLILCHLRRCVGSLVSIPFPGLLFLLPDWTFFRSDLCGDETLLPRSAERGTCALPVNARARVMDFGIMVSFDLPTGGFVEHHRKFQSYYRTCH